MTKKLYMKTYGCQMNVYDSERMTDVLAPFGYTVVDRADEADLVILNTCHIREKAAEKVYSELGRIKPRSRARSGSLVAVAGCVAQAEGEELLRRAPQVDIVVGPQTYHRLPELVARAERARDGRGIMDTDFPVESKFDFLPESARPSGAGAYLSVQEGCDKFCTFCVVPYTRGAEFSRPVRAIVREAEQLVARGARELTLLGQNVNAYHGEAEDGLTWGLGRLLRRLARIEGLERLRYTTSHPSDMDEELVRAHAEEPKLMAYLHLPVQSGSDRILAAMNRRHTAEDYLRLVERLRAARSDLALSSDFIVGFPGERDEDFAATLRLVSEVGFASAYSFKYSPRPGTPAATMEGQVPEAVKSERLESLQGLLAAQQTAFNRAMVGRRVEVLFDGPGRKANQIHGRTPYMQAVHVDVGRIGTAPLMNEIATVHIEAAMANSLSGSLCEKRQAGHPD